MARGARVGRARGGARARASSKDAATYLAVALAAAAVVGLDGRAAAHCHLDAFLAVRARAVADFAACRLSAGISPSAAALVCSCGASLSASWRDEHKGQPRLGAKHSGRFPTSAAATVSWEEILRLFASAGARADGS